MSETLNIAEVASKISKDIFRVFRWHTHPRKDDNFTCADSSHTSGRGKAKSEHPTDVVFSYQDPYAAARVHLLCDLKSYKASSITSLAARKALQSLAMSVECAEHSDEWKEKFAVAVDEPHAVRGLLFVHNHDGGYAKVFKDELAKVNVKTLVMRDGIYIHYLGPEDVNRLFDIATDILRLIALDELPKSYSFYYPDLVLSRRVGNVWDQQATIEVLAGPFVIIKYPPENGQGGGYLIYYNRAGATITEFEYLIDCLSRFQILDSGDKIRIRVSHSEVVESYKSNFEFAVNRYAKSWALDNERSGRIQSIEIDRVQCNVSSYNPGDCGWR
ncbi:hypothetical protein V8017_05585 [Stenotrophomonas rhizophila]